MASVPVAKSRAAPSAELGHVVIWRWVHVGIAALAMVLTLPGRTHGLGLFTESLLKSLALDRESYGFMNLWATLLGALFCLPCGWLLDRFGTRTVLLVVTSGLGATVMAMSRWTTGTWLLPISFSLPKALGGSSFAFTVMVDLFLFLLLTRGLGQSALSVVSLALVGRSAGRKSGLAMGVYAFCTSAGFMVAFIVLGQIILALATHPEVSPGQERALTNQSEPRLAVSRKSEPADWRPIWAGIGLSVLVLGVASAALVRNQIIETGAAQHADSTSPETSFTFGQAMASPTFWTFTLAISFLGLILAGTSLFNESILAERGFDQKVFITITQFGVPVGLAANLLVGWLATRWSLAKLMAGATGLFALALFSFPVVTTKVQVYAYAFTLAAAGGGMTVCFFAVYRRAFGPARLGSIQGFAQMLTVLFSAVGPLIFASTKVRLGSYSQLFPTAATIALVLAVLTWVVGMPKREGVILSAKLEA